MITRTDVLIIGGGLAGLRLADLLTGAGRDYVLVEARHRLGGRVLGHTIRDQTFDLGPAWFWQRQPRMAALVSRFGLSVFDQFSTGAGILETAEGRVQRVNAIASMQGALRVQGGMPTLCDALAAEVAQDRVLLNTPLLSCTRSPEGIIAMCGERQITARHIVLTLPPRMAARVQWTPDLEPATRQALETVPTWMAAQAKVIAFYERPFWRDAGLSGDGASYRGPMAEVHDASPGRGGPAALFGFIGLAPAQRQDETAMKQAVREQLIRLFGLQAKDLKDLVVKDWARDPLTSTPQDLAPLAPQSNERPALAPRGLWDGHVLFGGTEAARGWGGYLEGALEAAEQAFVDLNGTSALQAHP